MRDFEIALNIFFYRIEKALGIYPRAFLFKYVKFSFLTYLRARE